MPPSLSHVHEAAHLQLTWNRFKIPNVTRKPDIMKKLSTQNSAPVCTTDRTVGEGVGRGAWVVDSQKELAWVAVVEDEALVGYLE